MKVHWFSGVFTLASGAEDMDSFSLSNGLVMDCSARRSLALTYVRTAQILFLLSMFQKELQFGRVADSLAPLPCWVGDHMSVIWCGNSAHMGLLPGHWKPATISVSGQFVDYWVIRQVRQRSFWMVP